MDKDKARNKINWDSTRNNFRISNANPIITSLEAKYKEWNQQFPISFCISDYDEILVKQICTDLGFPRTETKRYNIGRNLYCLMIFIKE